jgi:large subunit ribosomal protein L21
MEAVVKIGGRQYRVGEGQRLEVDRLASEVGATVTFDQVLLIADGSGVSVGSPLVDGATVEAKVVAARRGPKILVYKYKAKKRYRRIRGHRSELSLLEVTSVTGPRGTARTRAKIGDARAADTTAAKPAPTVRKPAPRKKATA